MGSCVSKCYTGGVTSTEANVQCHSGIVTEKSVLVSESLPGSKPNHIPIEVINIAASSPSFTSVAYPNPFDSSPSSVSSSFSSSASANCSSFSQTPLESPVQEPSSFVAVEEKQKHEMLAMIHETLLEQREQTQATRRKLALARKARSCSQAARISETRNSFIDGRGSAMMATPAPPSRRLQRSNSVAGAAAGSRLDHVQLKNSTGRQNVVAGQRSWSSKVKLMKTSDVKQLLPRINQTQERARNGSEESTAEEKSFVDPVTEDINNPMISMDCFIFL